MTPFRLVIKGDGPMPREELSRIAELNAHVPRIRASKPHGRKLAVCGGGPLLVHDLAELRAWDGDIWGINYTAKWLNARGVRATLFSVDPAPETNIQAAEAPEAILATVCDPVLFEHFKGRVQAFDMCQTHGEGIANGSFSSTSAPAVSLRMGYTDVSFFGCEGSFTDQDHVDRHEQRPDQLIIRAGGRDYRTCPPYVIQCEELIKLFYFDNVYHNRSGGLLKAMIDYPDTWEVVAVSAALKHHLEERNGASGLYDGQYVPAAA